MNGATRSRATSQPLTAPSAMPATSAIATTSQVCEIDHDAERLAASRPRLNRQPATMPQRPTIDADGQVDAAAEDDERHADRRGSR